MDFNQESLERMLQQIRSMQENGEQVMLKPTTVIWPMEYSEKQMQYFMQRSYQASHGSTSTVAISPPDITTDTTVSPAGERS
jgi:hypothetical protein